MSKLTTEITEDTEIPEAQLLSYLRLGGLPAGLLINFNVQLLKHGIRRAECRG